MSRNICDKSVHLFNIFLARETFSVNDVEISTLYRAFVPPLKHS